MTSASRSVSPNGSRAASASVRRHGRRSIRAWRASRSISLRSGVGSKPIGGGVGLAQEVDRPARGRFATPYAFGRSEPRVRGRGGPPSVDPRPPQSCPTYRGWPLHGCAPTRRGTSGDPARRRFDHRAASAAACRSVRRSVPRGARSHGSPRRPDGPGRPQPPRPRLAGHANRANRSTDRAAQSRSSPCQAASDDSRTVSSSPRQAASSAVAAQIVGWYRSGPISHGHQPLLLDGDARRPPRTDPDSCRRGRG